MSDDPREILKAAGVECAEVEVYAKERRNPASGSGFWDGLEFMTTEISDSAILALSRLVAEASPLDWVATRTSRDGAQAVAAHFADYDDAHRYCKTMNRGRIGRGDRFTFRGARDG